MLSRVTVKIKWDDVYELPSTASGTRYLIHTTFLSTFSIASPTPVLSGSLSHKYPFGNFQHFPFLDLHKTSSFPSHSSNSQRLVEQMSWCETAPRRRPMNVCWQSSIGADLPFSSASLHQALETEGIYPLCILCISVPSDAGCLTSSPMADGGPWGWLEQAALVWTYPRLLSSKRRLKRETERAGFGKGLQPGGWARPCVENTFPKPPDLGRKGVLLPMFGPVITVLSFKTCYKPG